MIKRLIKQVLLKTKFIELLKPVMLLCEYFISNFWKMKYLQISAGYAHPTWFPHRLNLATWSEQRDSHFLERGIYSNEVIAPGNTVLELCSGDGFYSYFFFSKKAQHIDAIDIDQMALAHAQEYHSLPNIHYHQADIIKDPFPRNTYEVVIWDSAIRRLKKEEMKIVLEKISTVLKPTNGVFSCYEIIDDESHPIEFITPISAQELTEMFQTYFDVVQWRSSISPGRHNYYFHCYMKSKP
jgi:hypothetical protein